MAWVRPASVRPAGGGGEERPRSPRRQERLTPFPSRNFHQPSRVAFPPQYEPLETAITHVYQSLTYVEDAPAVQAWLRSALSPIPDDAEGTMLALCGLAAIGVTRVKSHPARQT